MLSIAHLHSSSPILQQAAPLTVGDLHMFGKATGQLQTTTLHVSTCSKWSANPMSSSCVLNNNSLMLCQSQVSLDILLGILCTALGITSNIVSLV